MKPKKVPLRKCVVSQDRLPKQELIRVLKTPEGNIIIDETHKANGRGAYLKKDEAVIKKAQKTKILDKVLEVPVPDSVYNDLLNMINK